VRTYSEHTQEWLQVQRLRSPLQLRGKAHPARPAAWAAHADQDGLLLLVVEIGALQHGRGLLLKQRVQREVAGEDLVVGRRRGRDRRRRLVFVLRHSDFDPSALH